MKYDQRPTLYPGSLDGNWIDETIDETLNKLYEQNWQFTCNGLYWNKMHQVCKLLFLADLFKNKQRQSTIIKAFARMTKTCVVLGNFDELRTLLLNNFAKDSYNTLSTVIVELQDKYLNNYAGDNLTGGIEFEI